MADLDPERILALLRDPNVDSEQVAAEAGVPRAEAARAALLLVTLAKARPEEVAALPPSLASALVRAATAAGRGDLLASLATAGERSLAKDAKRGLHLLRSRGVAVPEPERAPPPAPAPASEEGFPCYASSIDGHGERAVWVTRNVPGRGIEVGQAVVSDVLGLLELQVGLLGRKEFRSFGRDIADRGRTMGVAQIDPGLARSLVAAARRLNDSSGRRVPEGADAWLARLGPAAPLPDPADLSPALPPEEEERALAASGALHDLPMLRGWIADEDPLREVARKLDEIAASSLYADELQRAEHADRTVAEAVAAFLDEPRRQRLAARLHAVAAHLLALRDPPHAAMAAATARALRAGEPAERIPFARLLVEKAFPSRGPEAPPPGRAPVAPASSPGADPEFAPPPSLAPGR
jgi:hypothetical protein